MANQQKWYEVTVTKSVTETKWVKSTTPEGAKTAALKEVFARYEHVDFDEVTASKVRSLGEAIANVHH